MSNSDAIAIAVGMITATMIGLWFGMAMSIGDCVAVGKPYKHKLLNAAVTCTVVKEQP